MDAGYVPSRVVTPPARCLWACMCVGLALCCIYQGHCTSSYRHILYCMYQCTMLLATHCPPGGGGAQAGSLQKAEGLSHTQHARTQPHAACTHAATHSTHTRSHARQARTQPLSGGGAPARKLGFSFSLGHTHTHTHSRALTHTQCSAGGGGAGVASSRRGSSSPSRPLKKEEHPGGPHPSRQRRQWWLRWEGRQVGTGLRITRLLMACALLRQWEPQRYSS